MSTGKTDWKTVSTGEIPLTSQAGGFVAIELIAPVPLGAPHLQGAVVFEGTRAIARVAVSCPGLPADTTWRVEWHLPTAKEPILGPPAKRERGVVEAILDLATGGEVLGRFLEAPESLTLRLTPDYPHVEPDFVNLHLDFAHPLALRIAEHALSKIGSFAGAHVGQRLALELSRSDWRCDVRLRVDTPGEQDVVVPFEKGKSAAPWIVGMSPGGALQLPEPTRDSLPFALVLEVSANGAKGPWSPLLTSVLTVPVPSLTSLEVEIAPGAQRMITPSESESWLDDLLADRHVYAVGRFSGFANRFDPPFALELWMARAVSSNPGAPVVIQPLHGRRVAIDALRDGAFRVEMDLLSTEADALHYRDTTPFVILRAGAAEPLPPLQRCFSFPLTFVPFSDEDVWRKGDVLGVCSAGVSHGMALVREPVMGAVSYAVEKEALVLYCGVLGPREQWKAAKPRFVLQAGQQQITKDATVVEVANSEKGRLRAEIPLKALGPFCGSPAEVRVELGAKETIIVPPGAGRLAGLVIQPRLGPVEWDEDDAGHLRFVCRTAFFPKGAQPLVATLSDTAGGTVKFDAVVYAEKGGRVGDEGLVFFPSDKDASRCKDLIAAGSLQISVGLPPPKTQLYDVPAVTVTAWTGPPTARKSAR